MGPMIAGVAGLAAGWGAARLAGLYAAVPSKARLALMMVAMAEAWAWAALTAPAPVVLFAGLTLAWALLCLAAVDVACFRLPDALTLPLAATGLAVSLVLPGRPFLQHLAGAVLGYGALAVMAWAYRRLRGREGMGLGDAKLLGAAGAWLGPALLPQVVLFACLLAFGWIAVRIAGGERDLGRMRIAFGAPLCLSIWLVWLYAPLLA